MLYLKILYVSRYPFVDIDCHDSVMFLLIHTNKKCKLNVHYNIGMITILFEVSDGAVLSKQFLIFSNIYIRLGDKIKFTFHRKPLQTILCQVIYHGEVVNIVIYYVSIP